MAPIPLHKVTEANGQGRGQHVSMELGRTTEATQAMDTAELADIEDAADTAIRADTTDSTDAGRVTEGRSAGRQPAHAARRPPSSDGPPPFLRILGLAAWAALLTLVGTAVAVRASLALILDRGTLPGWYQPILMVSGVSGIVLTIVALASVRKPYLPWLLLPGATLALALSLLVTAIAVP